MCESDTTAVKPQIMSECKTPHMNRRKWCWAPLLSTKNRNVKLQWTQALSDTANRQSDQTQFLLRLKMVGSENLSSTAWIHGPNLACVNSCCSHSVYFKGQSLFEYCSRLCASSKGCPQYDDVSCLKLLLWTWQRVKWTSVASASNSSLSQLLWDVVTQQ